MGSGVNGMGLTYGAHIDARLARQSQRIDAGVANGQLSQQQATELLNQDTMVAQQETGMIGTNGGLNGADRKLLSSELNANSAAIYSQRHPGAPAPQPTPVSSGTPSSTGPSGVTGPGHVTSDPANNVITTRDGSTIASDGNGGFVYTDATTGQQTNFTGDPHVYENATNAQGQPTFSVQGPFQIQTKDGSVLNVQTTPPDANGATVITGVDVIGPGNHRATMTGINTGQVQTSGVSYDGAQYRNELGPSATVLSNQGTINGQTIGGADWTTANPATGQLSEVTGGDNVNGFTFGNSVDQAAQAWNWGQGWPGSVTGQQPAMNMLNLVSQLTFPRQ
jgi:hypothetical protein